MEVQSLRNDILNSLPSRVVELREELTQIPDQQSSFVEAQEHLAAIVQSSDDAIISKNLAGIIQSWNPAAERIFGYTSEEAIGQHISMLVVPDRIEEIPNILERIGRGERIDHYETRRKTKDGRVLTVSLSISPVRNPSGCVIGASKVARDITDQTRTRQALQAANDSLVRSVADLEQFTYSASHDLREPLRTVCTSAELLRASLAGKIDQGEAELLQYIISGVMRMEQLLSDLHAFTRLSSEGEMPAELDSEAVLPQVLSNLQSAIKESGAVITHGALPVVHLHKFQMEQLLQNLLGNAIRYRSERPLKIHVDASRTDASWRFSVTDNGIGIDPQYTEQIFGVFKRLHSFTEYPGTGMGLAICQRIVQRAGGRIWVESELGKGSTFFFTLPAAQS
jgi:PAS domain S-box-containing protein